MLKTNHAHKIEMIKLIHCYDLAQMKQLSKLRNCCFYSI